jgi:hypothetical protein
MRQKLFLYFILMSLLLSIPSSQANTQLITFKNGSEIIGLTVSYRHNYSLEPQKHTLVIKGSISLFKPDDHSDLSIYKECEFVGYLSPYGNYYSDGIFQVCGHYIVRIDTTQVVETHPQKVQIMTQLEYRGMKDHHIVDKKGFEIISFKEQYFNDINLILQPKHQ